MSIAPSTLYSVRREYVLKPDDMSDVKLHEACTFPDELNPDDFDRLRTSIKEVGVQEPVKFQASTGKLVAGRNRLRACKKLGVPCPAQDIDITDIDAWKFSRSQLAHRNLSKSRAATIQIEMEEKVQALEHAQDEGEHAEGNGKPKAKKEKPKRAQRGSGRKDTGTAKKAGVSVSTIERARKVKKKGIPALWKAMDQGLVTVNDAWKICEEEHDIQAAALTRVKNKESKSLIMAVKAIKKEAQRQATAFKDAVGNEVPGKLKIVFEDREEFVMLSEVIKDARHRLVVLQKRSSGKHLPKEHAQHLEDIVAGLEQYQPWAVDEKSEDGWITKASYQKR